MAPLLISSKCCRPGNRARSTPANVARTFFRGSTPAGRPIKPGLRSASGVCLVSLPPYRRPPRGDLGPPETVGAVDAGRACGRRRGSTPAGMRSTPAGFGDPWERHRSTPAVDVGRPAGPVARSTPAGTGPPVKRPETVGTGVHLTRRSLVNKCSPEQKIIVKSVKTGGPSYRFSGSHIARRDFGTPRFGTFFLDRRGGFFPG